MTAVNFATADELVAYVVDEGIVIGDIVEILVSDARWYLFHF